MAVVDLRDLKLALGLDVARTDDDYELQSKVLAAEAAYVRHVGPLPGTYTRTLALPALLPRGVTSASALYAGAAAAVTFDPVSGLLASPYSYGPVEVTYTVEGIADDHLESIIADVAEYWDRTQRTGGSAGRPGYEAPGFDAPAGGRPVTMYPRIMALASSQIA